MQLLAGKVALITGANRGIGLATARKLHSQGAHVLLVGRSRDALLKSFSSEPFQERVSYYECDVTDPTATKNLFQEVFAEHRKLHVVVSNAGMMKPSLVSMVPAESLNETFAVNTFGTFYVNQYASRLIARSGGGSIINVSSILGLNGGKGQSAYSASKAAVVGLTKSLAKELASSNIRVNAVAPGLIATDLLQNLPQSNLEESTKGIALGRIGTPEEVADVILFLASDMSRYVTGQVIGVDGGMLI